MNKKLSICFFFIPLTVSLLTAQAVRIPVSASDPYGASSLMPVNGNVVQVTEYRGPDIDKLTIQSLSIYQNKKIQSTIQYEDADTPRLLTQYAYTTDGKLLSITGNDSSSSMRWKYEYSYDKYGRQIEEKSYKSANTLEGRITTEYTNSGAIHQRNTYNEKDELTLKETFQYNERGFVAADITQYPDGKLLKRTIYTYTKGGHIADETHYDAGGLYERVGYTYTDAGQLVSFSNVGKDYSIQSRTVLQYDGNGKIIHQTITGKDKSITTLSYIYDNNGNWVRKSDGSSYTLRKIIYGQ